MKTEILTRVVMLLISLMGHHYSIAQDKRNDQLIDEMENYLLSAMDEGDIPGLSIVIVDREEAIIKSYGYADLESGASVNSKTLFELGSCSKAFTALALTKLEQEKKVDLDSYVSDYLPWFKVQFEEKEQKITLNQLLYHTSGIPWNTISKIPVSDADDALEQTVRQLIGQELEEVPGKRYEYATINYDVLALVIEKITNTTFEAYVQSNVIDEIGLNHTSIGIPKDAQQMSTGYKIGFFRPRAYDAPVYKGNYAAGYVISNAEDMAKWLKFQMGQANNGLSNLVAATHERDETVAIHGMDLYARGWEISLDGTGKIFHAGLNPNFSSFVVFL